MNEDTMIARKPAVVQVTTRSGAVYHIDFERGDWDRNGSEYHQRLWDFRTGDRSVTPDLDDWDTERYPVVGQSIFIKGGGLHDWYLSTPVVSIEEISREDSWLTDSDEVGDP